MTHLAMGTGAEFDVIRRLLHIWGDAAEGIGDDAATLRVPVGEQLCVSTDACVEHVHFRREWLTPREVGARAAAAALSDLAAMAATPVGLLLALALPESWRADVEEIARGVSDVAHAVQCPIVGGNMSAARELSLVLTVLGTAAQPLRRNRTRAGDALYVTGTLGGPAAALHAWLEGREPAAPHRERFARPTPRIAEARWLADAGVCAAIDISDGLAADAAHLANASGVSIVLDANAVPRVAGVTLQQAIAGGEEYELLFASRPEIPLDLETFRSRFGVSLTRVGTIVARMGSAVHVDGADVASLHGHNHFP